MYGFLCKGTEFVGYWAFQRYAGLRQHKTRQNPSGAAPLRVVGAEVLGDACHVTMRVKARRNASPFCTFRICHGVDMHFSIPCTYHIT